MSQNIKRAERKEQEARELLREATYLRDLQKRLDAIMPTATKPILTDEIISRCYEHGQPDYVAAADRLKQLQAECASLREANNTWVAIYGPRKYAKAPQEQIDLADALQHLCCAETEGEFFDCVTDNIGKILLALRNAPPQESENGC